MKMFSLIWIEDCQDKGPNETSLSILDSDGWVDHGSRLTSKLTHSNHQHEWGWSVGATPPLRKKKLKNSHSNNHNNLSSLNSIALNASLLQRKKAHKHTPHIRPQQHQQRLVVLLVVVVASAFQHHQMYANWEQFIAVRLPCIRDLLRRFAKRAEINLSFQRIKSWERVRVPISGHFYDKSVKWFHFLTLVPNNIKTLGVYRLLFVVFR